MAQARRRFTRCATASFVEAPAPRRGRPRHGAQLLAFGVSGLRGTDARRNSVVCVGEAVEAVHVRAAVDLLPLVTGQHKCKNRLSELAALEVLTRALYAVAVSTWPEDADVHDRARNLFRGLVVRTTDEPPSFDIAEDAGELQKELPITTFTPMALKKPGKGEARAARAVRLGRRSGTNCRFAACRRRRRR